MFVFHIKAVLQIKNRFQHDSCLTTKTSSHCRFQSLTTGSGLQIKQNKIDYPFAFTE